jgi:outer membrane protein OmpA-like peptidoglycan-associated protein
MKLTEKGQKALVRLGILVLLVAGVAGLRWAAVNGYGRKLAQSLVPEKVDIGTTPFTDGGVAAADKLALPSTDVADMTGKPQVRILGMAWNAQMACLAAIGGAQPTRGSLAEKHGVDLRFTRQDDYAQMQAELTRFAKELHDGTAQPTGGAHYVAIMGDGAAAFLTPLNEKLQADFGDEYRAEIIGSCGYSVGEDKLMGPQEWKRTPASIRGKTIAGYLRDGDWNIALRFAGDNNIPNNPDETTYDPDAINWISADSYVDAAQKYVAGYCEDRPVVRQGKKTGETHRVCADGVVTWTPGDVIVAEGRGGLVSVVSTREYSGQMPNTLIGIRKWNQANRATVESMLQAFFEAADQVKTHPEWLQRGAEASHAVYNEANTSPEYWVKYYRGVTERDKQGLQVELGGSKVNNLADNQLLFGLAPGTTTAASRYRSVYNVFGAIVKEQYPALVPRIQPYDEVVDVSYIQGVARKMGPAVAAADVETYDASRRVTEVVGRATYRITFATGKAEFTGDAQKELQRLFDNMQVNSLAIEVHGHTDNVGDPAANMQLSEDRALAVKQWLEAKSAAAFPQGRVRVFAHGSTQPLVSNRTADGKAQNRRVEIVIGS